MTRIKRTAKLSFEELDRRISPRYAPGDESGIFFIVSEGFRSDRDPKYRGRYYRTECRFCKQENIKKQELLVRGEIDGSYCSACKKSYPPTRGPGDKQLGETEDAPLYKNKYPVNSEAGVFEVMEAHPAGRSWIYKVRCKNCLTVSNKKADMVRDAYKNNYVICGKCREILGQSAVKELYRRRKEETTKEETTKFALNAEVIEEDGEDGKVMVRERARHDALASFDLEILKLALSGRWGEAQPITFGIRCWFEGAEL